MYASAGKIYSLIKVPEIDNIAKSDADLYMSILINKAKEIRILDSEHIESSISI